MKYRIKFYSYWYAVRGLQYVAGYVFTFLVSATLHFTEIITLGSNTAISLALGAFIAWNAILILNLPLRIRFGRKFWRLGCFTSLFLSTVVSTLLWPAVVFLYPSGWLDVSRDIWSFGSAALCVFSYAIIVNYANAPKAESVYVRTSDTVHKEVFTDPRKMQNYDVTATGSKSFFNPFGVELTFKQALQTLGLRQRSRTPYNAEWVDEDGKVVLTTS